METTRESNWGSRLWLGYRKILRRPMQTSRRCSAGFLNSRKKTIFNLKLNRLRKETKMKVSIFGLGYVGCVTAGCLGREGHEVIGVDVVASKVEKLAAGRPTVVETGLDDLIGEAHQQGRITATTDGMAAVLASNASIICVGTPTGPDGNLDLTALRQTAQLIGQAIREKMDRHVVILRSTVPAGTAESVVLPLLHPERPASHLYQDSDLVVVPEFLREGCAISDYYAPPFVVVGS